MKLIRKTKYYFIGLLFTIPFTVFAASTLIDIEVAVLSVLNKTVPLFIAIAVTFFVWNVLKYVNSGDNAEERAQARAFITYSIIAIFVMVSLWGFIWVLRNMFNLSNSIPVDFNNIIIGP